jgi:hypothetical protein
MPTTMRAPIRVTIAQRARLVQPCTSSDRRTINPFNQAHPSLAIRPSAAPMLRLRIGDGYGDGQIVLVGGVCLRSVADRSDVAR